VILVVRGVAPWRFTFYTGVGVLSLADILVVLGVDLYSSLSSTYFTGVLSLPDFSLVIF
jgi:hypothetical protein